MLQIPEIGSTKKLAPPQEQPAPTKPRPGFVPPLNLLLRGLGITERDLGMETVTVSTAFLRFIISEIVSRGAFDPVWYADRYPDVEGARLAGQVASLHAHYCRQGYFEGRFSGEMPFDPDWYYSRYEDVARAFSPADPEALRRHFETQGCLEGRAGTPEQRKDADRWVEAVRGKR